MQFTIVVFAGLAGLASAAPVTSDQTPPSTFQALPTCYRDTFNQMIENSGCQFTGERNHSYRLRHSDRTIKC
jgi:hypothetical protein